MYVDEWNTERRQRLYISLWRFYCAYFIPFCVQACSSFKCVVMDTISGPGLFLLDHPGVECDGTSDGAWVALVVLSVLALLAGAVAVPAWLLVRVRRYESRADKSRHVLFLDYVTHGYRDGYGHHALARFPVDLLCCVAMLSESYTGLSAAVPGSGADPELVSYFGASVLCFALYVTAIVGYYLSVLMLRPVTDPPLLLMHAYSAVELAVYALYFACLALVSQSPGLSSSGRTPPGSPISAEHPTGPFDADHSLGFNFDLVVVLLLVVSIVAGAVLYCYAQFREYVRRNFSDVEAIRSLLYGSGKVYDLAKELRAEMTTDDDGLQTLEIVLRAVCRRAVDPPAEPAADATTTGVGGGGSGAGTGTAGTLVGATAGSSSAASDPSASSSASSSSSTTLSLSPGPTGLTTAAASTAAVVHTAAPATHTAPATYTAATTRALSRLPPAHRPIAALVCSEFQPYVCSKMSDFFLYVL
jgi:hypothetical protein